MRSAGLVDETDVGRHDAGSSREVDARHDSVADAELGELSYRELKDRVMTLAGERARVEGEYLAALGEMTSRVGVQAAAHHLRELTRMNSS